MKVGWLFCFIYCITLSLNASPAYYSLPFQMGFAKNCKSPIASKYFTSNMTTLDHVKQIFHIKHDHIGSCLRFEYVIVKIFNK
jgi:hypothetical protein